MIGNSYGPEQNEMGQAMVIDVRKSVQSPEGVGFVVLPSLIRLHALNDCLRTWVDAPDFVFALPRLHTLVPEDCPENRFKSYPQYQEDTYFLEVIDAKSALAEDVSQPSYQPQAVCFCDIPVEHLGFHMQKYGRYGLAFRKRFLIEKGASPVFYVARNSKPADAILESREEYFQQEFERYQKLWATGAVRDALDSSNLHKFLAFHVFGFIKMFDDTLPEDDPNNFYMEREWRRIGNVHFELYDVARVILPEAFGQRFREDLPDYVGEFNYAEQIQT